MSATPVPSLKLVQSAARTPPRDTWFKMFPTVWLADELLALCSMAAQGLLMALLCLMHRAKPCGYLLIGGKAPTDAELTRLVRLASAVELRRLRAELLDRGVLSVTAEGVFYSRRMVRDAEHLALRRQRGRLGGNPALLPTGLIQVVNHLDKAEKGRTGDRRERKTARGRSAGSHPVFAGTTFTLSEKQHAVVVGFLGIRKNGLDLARVYGDADAEWARVGFQPDDLLRELKQRAKLAADAKSDLLTGPDDYAATRAKLDHLEGRGEGGPNA